MAQRNRQPALHWTALCPTNSPEVIDAARNFLEAAQRANIYHQGERQGRHGSLLYATQHNAVLACALFLKALSSVSVWLDEGRPVEPRPGRVYRLGTTVPRSEDGTDGKHAVLSTHDGLFSLLPRKTREQLTQCLGSHADLLDDLKTPLMASRYPWELWPTDDDKTLKEAWKQHGRPDTWLLIAETLDRFVSGRRVARQETAT